MASSKIASKENAYTPNRELSLFFIRCVKDHFTYDSKDKELYNEINHYLTSNSGIAALNILSGYEIVSAAAMFRVLRMINSEKLNSRFLDNPLTLGNKL